MPNSRRARRRAARAIPLPREPIARLLMCALLLAAMVLFVMSARAQEAPPPPDATQPAQETPPPAAQQAPSDQAPQTEEQFSDAPAPPDIPEPLQSGQPIEPQVTIVHKPEATIEEYRVNGRMYMVKITPKVGKPYYLVDRDGDGRFESRMSTVYDDLVVPQWVLFSW